MNVHQGLRKRATKHFVGLKCQNDLQETLLFCLHRVTDEKRMSIRDYQEGASKKRGAQSAKQPQAATGAVPDFNPSIARPQTPPRHRPHKLLALMRRWPYVLILFGAIMSFAWAAALVLLAVVLIRRWF
jgi:hypothetical protein